MRAIIYTRVSSDQTGSGRSVSSQEAECRAVCERLGWDVAEVLCDNDIGASRHTGKQRPEYQRLSQVLRQGDVLVVWEASRAQRDLASYVVLRDLCAKRGVFWSYSGKLYDLSNGDDRFSTGLDALLAEKEADVISERVLRGKRKAAEEGRPAGRPPYGYRRQLDPLTGKTTAWVIDDETGPIVKEVITRVLAGQSLWAIVSDLKARGIPAPQVQANAAKEWKPQRLGRTICSPTYAGWRTHQGQIARDEAGKPVKGHWKALITPRQHQKLVALLTDPARRTNAHRGSAPRHLLTGVARCGVCGAGMRFFGPKSVKNPTYVCESKSCVRRRADAVDALVTETLIARMRRADAVALFTHTDDERVAAALSRADTLRQRLAGYIERAAAGEITDDSFVKIEARLLPQIEAAETNARAGVTEPLVAAMAGPHARKQWQAFSIADRRTVVAALLDVTVNPATTRRGFDPGDIDIVWRTQPQ